MNEQTPSQRIDKWLWHARIIKSRSLAQKLITSGKVRVDTVKITNASSQVRSSNVLTISLERDIKIIEITGIPKRRGPFSEAQTFYNDLTPPKEPKPKNTKGETITIGIEGTGKPDKHQRKQILAMKRNSTGQMD